MPTPTNPRIESAIKTGMVISHAVLETERELNALKWFAYRFISPLEATMLFYDAYLEGRRDFVRQNVDVALKVNDKPFSLLTPKELTQTWRARQRADQLGLPYSFYVNYGIWFWGRRSGPGRSKAPRPNQIHFKRGNESAETAWNAEIEKVAPEAIANVARRLADVPELRATAFAGAPGQTDMREFVVWLCQNRPGSWDMAVRKWCYDFPVMSLLSMRRIIPHDMWLQVRDSLHRDPPIASVAAVTRPVNLRPSCFAIPRAHGPCAACRCCAFASSCKEGSATVLEMIRSRAGVVDPRRTALREAPNARQRALYYRKKAEASVSAGS